MNLDEALANPDPRWQWSVRIDRVGGPPECIYQHDPALLLRTASVGKLFLLVEVADRVVRGQLDPHELLDRESTAAVSDSGLWQYLSVSRLPVVDVARLVGSVSDNWATNVLIDQVGLDSVQARARSLVTNGSVLHDHVRELRSAEHPPTLSEGCATDLVLLLGELHRSAAVGEPVSTLVLDWLSTSLDLSMAAAALGLDPLSHASADRGHRVWNKTGTDTGVRADVGLIAVHGETYAYAAICNWPEDETDPTVRDLVLATMRLIGERLRQPNAATRAVGQGASPMHTLGREEPNID